MEKLEKFYKGKFENHEEVPMPDAFDKIMKELEKYNGKEADISAKPFSSLLKISISLNALLIAAVPVMYYLLSSNPETPIVDREKTQRNNQISQFPETADSRIQTDEKTSIYTEKKEVKNSTEWEKKNLVEGTVPVSLQKEISVKETRQTVLDNTKETSTPVDIKTEEQPAEVTKEKEVVTNLKPEKKKRNSDLYYEENASRLKDSTNLLFKKKK